MLFVEPEKRWKLNEDAGQLASFSKRLHCFKELIEIGLDPTNGIKY